MSDEAESKPGNGVTDGAHEGTVGVSSGSDERLSAVEAERDEMKDRMLRIAAEFENWKKRARKEQEDSEAKARESVLRDVLDVLDNLERAVGAYSPAKGGAAGTGAAGAGKGAAGAGGAGKGAAAAGGAVDGPAILKGVELVLRLFQSKLERYGIKSIAAVGEPFDPRLHEAISRVETADIPPGHVAVELQRGYRIADRLLRPSMVSVATAPAKAAGQDGGGGSGGAEDEGA